WLFNDLLTARARQRDWFLSVPLQQLATGSRSAEQAWNGLIARFRDCLEQRDEALQRVQEISVTDLDEKLDDFVAEMIAVVYLSQREFSRFHFCPPGNAPLPDLRAVRGGREVFIEVKNLREPNSVANVAISRWHANRANDPERFAFDVDVL